MIGALAEVCDPDAVDQSAKAAQTAKVEEYGGREEIVRSGTLVYTPAPGHKPEMREIS